MPKREPPVMEVRVKERERETGAEETGEPSDSEEAVVLVDLSSVCW